MSAFAGFALARAVASDSVKVRRFPDGLRTAVESLPASTFARAGLRCRSAAARLAR